MLKDYLLDNWALIIILLAFAISLKETVFLDKKTVRQMYALVIEIFLLSIAVFVEFYFSDLGEYSMLRTVLMAIRYSATPFIFAQIIHTLIWKFRWFVFLPAIILAVINFVSVFTGIVFRINEDGTLHRGPLGFLPYIVVGIYCVVLIYVMIKHSNKKKLEVLPLAFLGFAFLSGLVLPFIYGKAYSRIFCTIIAVGLYVYYVFLLLQLTKKDSLTGLLNRAAYYAEIENDPESITALLSIDMDGLKTINDNYGHAAGDRALKTLAACFTSALKSRQTGYRVGGDEFVIICRRTTEDEVIQLVERIRKNVSETEYICSVGYSFNDAESKSMDEMLKESDDMMYAEKARHYEKAGKARR
ncbi:MAG: GGDEF domain-containing protein [Parasporobacterium sp.]|nr:GGDEF domain-containing protein [Parasporobacterium sp.]